MKGINREIDGPHVFSVLLVLIGAISYGLLSALIKVAYDDGFTVAQITSGQVILGTCFLWFIVAVRPRTWSNPFRGPWIRLSLIGVFGLFATTLLFNTSLNYLDASLGIVLLFQFTWITLMLDCFADKKWPTFFQVVAILLIMTGTLLAVNIMGANLANVSPLGIILGLLSACTYAGFIFFAGRVKTDMDPVMRSAIMWTAAVPLLLLIWPAVVLYELNTAQVLFWGIILGILGQVIPTITFNIGIPRIGSSLAAMIGSIELPAAILFAFILLNEQVIALQWLGIVLIIIGIISSEWKIKVRRR